MKKPASLRAAFAVLLPEHARDYDRLAMWVEKGHIRSRLGAQHGFAWEYELTVLIKGYGGDPAVPFFIVTEWLREQQPEVLGPGGKNGFAFEADILDQEICDIQIVLQLDECVAAIPQGSGQWHLQDIAQPVPIDPDGEPIRANSAPLLSIWHDGQQIAPLTGA